MNAQDFIQLNKDYGPATIRKTSDGKDVVVISDLHLSAGLQIDNNYDGTENFYADESLARFLQYLTSKQKGNKTILIINGDFIDFLRILHYPVTATEFDTWKSILTKIGISKSIQELKSSISKKEKDFGLRTDDYKSVWKLNICVNGHKILFQELAVWLSQGNELIITKGNHDLEWYWPAVRDYLRIVLFEFVQNTNGNTDPNAVLNNLVFADDSLIIDNKIHIAHGHVFENMTEVKGTPTVDNGSQLNLPFGSFFNRYLINRLELSYPFLDNIRPTGKIFPLLIRERFPLALKYMVYYIPFAFLVIPKKLYKEVLKYLFDVFLIIIVPVALVVFVFYKNVHIPAETDKGVIAGFLTNTLKSLWPLLLSYFFARIMSMARLSSPPTFYPFAQKIYAENQAIQTVIFGHTHNPEQRHDNGKWYYNTGTWMPVYDLSMADVRLDKTYTYLHIVPGTIEKIDGQKLLRWNDDAVRPEPMVLRDLK